MSTGSKPRCQQRAAIRVMMMPRDTNAMGTIFGGIILSYIDQAGAVEAHRICHGILVTVAMNAVEFHQPVFVGDLVSFYADVFEVGRTSMKIKVVVEAERRIRGNKKVMVTEAEIVYVHVDRDGNPIPIEPKAEAGK